MRLYVTCPTTNQRVYLALYAERRSQLDFFITVKCPHDQQFHTYMREQVQAEPTLGASAGGAILGGILGALLAGPLGLILAGGAGYLVGTNTEEEERRKVLQFSEG